jgi:GMP synthase (glutamine-hydrolysing)
METFNSHLQLPVTCVDHTGPMLEKLKGLSDPEAKRKAIGGAFIDVFKAYAVKLEKELGTKPKFLVQVCGAAGARLLSRVAVMLAG